MATKVVEKVLFGTGTVVWTGVSAFTALCASARLFGEKLEPGVYKHGYYALDYRKGVYYGPLSYLKRNDSDYTLDDKTK